MTEKNSLVPKLFQRDECLKPNVSIHFGSVKDNPLVMLEEGFPICKECALKVDAKISDMVNSFPHLKDKETCLSVQVKVRNFFLLFLRLVFVKILQSSDCQLLLCGVVTLRPRLRRD